MRIKVLNVNLKEKLRINELIKSTHRHRYGKKCKNLFLNEKNFDRENYFHRENVKNVKLNAGILTMPIFI